MRLAASCILATLIAGFSVRADDTEVGVLSPTVKINLTGTPSGGSLTLYFPIRTFDRPNSVTGEPQGPVTIPSQISVQTVLGDTAADAADKVRQAYIAINAYGITEMEGNIIRIHGFSRGEVALSSTDPGINTLPGVGNVTSQVTPEKFVTLSWTLPQGVTYDKVYVYRGSLPVGVLAANATTCTDQTIPRNEFPAEDASEEVPELAYRIIGVKTGPDGDLPSGLATITVRNPNAP